MIRHRIVFLSVVVALVLATTPVSAGAAESAGAGLWPSDYAAAPTNCGSFSRDANNFCNTGNGGDGGAAVELGVKFTTSKPVLAAGVRIYRIDAGSVTGSLWSSDGTLLATGQFAGAATHGWQDLVFTQPVSIGPGTTYIASYHAPDAEYAFEYDFFTNSALTVGPITALQSVEGDRNGVYCYLGESCNLFPTNSYRNLNYWVTPLWAYAFNGFFQPVDNGVWNSAKAGSAIPVKFSLGGDLGLNVLSSGSPTAAQIACPGSTVPVDAIEETATASASGLTFDATAGQYTYAWKTNKAWAGKCFHFELGLNDGTSHGFDVKFPM